MSDIHVPSLYFSRWVSAVNMRLSSSHHRCFFIAQSYVLVKKWSEALVLYERVLKYAKEVQSKAKGFNNSLKVGHYTALTSQFKKK